MTWFHWRTRIKNSPYQFVSHGTQTPVSLVEVCCSFYPFHRLSLLQVHTFWLFIQRNLTLCPRSCLSEKTEKWFQTPAGVQGGSWQIVFTWLDGQQWEDNICQKPFEWKQWLRTNHFDISADIYFYSTCMRLQNQTLNTQYNTDYR